MSWIRALDESFNRDVAFFYSVASQSDALYLDEISAAAAAHPTVHPHVVTQAATDTSPPSRRRTA